jgi:hypothetical protein
MPDETLEDLLGLQQRFSMGSDAVSYIMDTFPIVRARDEETFGGNYRTKQLILQIYNSLQESLSTGRPYISPLDPPPGPPIDRDGKFADYSKIATNPPAHVHLQRKQGDL